MSNETPESVKLHDLTKLLHGLQHHPHFEYYAQESTETSDENGKLPSGYGWEVNDAIEGTLGRTHWRRLKNADELGDIDPFKMPPIVLKPVYLAEYLELLSRFINRHYMPISKCMTSPIANSSPQYIPASQMVQGGFHSGFYADEAIPSPPIYFSCMLSEYSNINIWTNLRTGYTAVQVQRPTGKMSNWAIWSEHETLSICLKEVELILNHWT